MLTLAGAPDDYVSAARIAERMGIPVRFIPRVMSDLSAAGLVEAREGRSGGYRLARPAAAITLLDIIAAVEGDLRRRACVLRGTSCNAATPCTVHPVFEAAQAAVLDRLATATLAAVTPAPEPGGPFGPAENGPNGTLIRRLPSG